MGCETKNGHHETSQACDNKGRTSLRGRNQRQLTKEVYPLVGRIGYENSASTSGQTTTILCTHHVTSWADSVTDDILEPSMGASGIILCRASR